MIQYCMLCLIQPFKTWKIFCLTLRNSFHDFSWHSQKLSLDWLMIYLAATFVPGGGGQRTRSRSVDQEAGTGQFGRFGWNRVQHDPKKTCFYSPWLFEKRCLVSNIVTASPLFNRSRVFGFNGVTVDVSTWYTKDHQLSIQNQRTISINPNWLKLRRKVEGSLARAPSYNGWWLSAGWHIVHFFF